MTAPLDAKSLGTAQTVAHDSPLSAKIANDVHDTSAELSQAPTLLASSVASTVASSVASSVAVSRRTAPDAAPRTTILPRLSGHGTTAELVLTSQARYEPMKVLGAGGMGEVLLVRDNDIARPVAVKRLLPELQDGAVLARFVEEIRTVGRLEHPNIVPIHDVGIDDLGRYFFVMKYVEGETLESIIAKLAAGDAEYRHRFSFERRIEIFLGVLHALDFAHANGFVHRDIKPANVMIGRYGEVMVMDWGIAKPIAAKGDAARSADGRLSIGGPGHGEHGEHGERARLFATQVGALIGTPAYMAPEQARGEHDKIDVRSDLYSATVLFHELVSLQHYLHDKQTVESMLAGTITEEFGFFKLLTLHGEHQGLPPGELVHFCVKGLAKDPEKRFQSAAEMIAELEGVLEGNVRVQCHITFTKRTTRRLGQLVDRSPNLAFGGLLVFVALLVFAVVQAIRLIA